jgi:hypothetical protein
MDQRHGMVVCALLSGTAVAFACGNEQASEGNGNLVSFVGSPCKKEASAAAPVGSTQQALVTSVDGQALVGLKCIAWEATGTDGLKVDLVNFEGACGAQWSGSSTVDANGSLALRLENPGCRVASCGWCIYDWSFEVRGVGSSSALPVSITIDTCPGQQAVETYQATLPVSSSPEGLLCRYANWDALGWQAMATNACGSLHMPCVGTSMCSSTVTTLSCNAGLVCDTNGTADQFVCLAPCTVEADCPGAGTLSCESGLCRLKQTW